VIDFHNHFYPVSYLDALKRGETAVEVTEDPEGNPILHYPGDYNVAVRGHRDIAFRQEVIEREGVGLQVLTLTTPGTHVEEPPRAVALARLVNDSFHSIAQARPDRFTALATLPLNDVPASVDELERAVKQLGFKGAMLFSNVNGIALADECFLPLYERANQLGAVLHIHPTSPVGVEAMKAFWLMPLVGFLMDTTLAAAHLVFAGVPERFPKISWVLSHLGGAIPYLAERLDRGFDAFPECRERISLHPSEYLKRFYYDTVNFDRAALRLAASFAGVDHILAGSDYPHQIGSLRSMLQSLRGLDLSRAQQDQILGGNAARLLGLGAG
jgi:aminocarboxymuconate-semialdehyde decarboxylase